MLRLKVDMFGNLLIVSNSGKEEDDVYDILSITIAKEFVEMYEYIVADVDIDGEEQRFALMESGKISDEGSIMQPIYIPEPPKQYIKVAVGFEHSLFTSPGGNAVTKAVVLGKEALAND